MARGINKIVLSASALAVFSLTLTGMLVINESQSLFSPDPAPDRGAAELPDVSAPPTVRTRFVATEHRLRRIEKKLEELGVECASEDCFPVLAP